MVTGFACLNYAVSSFVESPFHIYFFFFCGQWRVLLLFLLQRYHFRSLFRAKNTIKFCLSLKQCCITRDAKLKSCPFFARFPTFLFFFARALKPQSGKNCLGNRAGEMRSYPFHFPIKKSVIIPAKFNGPFLLRRDVWKLAGFCFFHFIQQSNAPFFLASEEKVKCQRCG